MSILAFLAGIAVFAANSAAESCDDGFVLLNHVCIKFDKIRLGGFKTQQERCREEGAFMIAPDDAEEEANLFDYINRQWPRSRPRFWIGLKLRKGRDAGVASNYYWQNSRTKNTQFPSGALPWEKEFPRRTPAFRCVMSTLRGSWVNARCDTQLALACQYDPKVGRNLPVKTPEEFVTESPFVTTYAKEDYSGIQDSQDYIADFVTPATIMDSNYPTATESYSQESVTESQIYAPAYETFRGDIEDEKWDEQQNEGRDEGENYYDEFDDNNYEENDADADNENFDDENTFDSNIGLNMVNDFEGTNWDGEQLFESMTEEPVQFEDTTKEPNANNYDNAYLDTELDNFDYDDDDDEDHDKWKSYQLSESTAEEPLLNDNDDHFDVDMDDNNDDVYDVNDVNKKIDDNYDDTGDGENIFARNMGENIDDIQDTVWKNDQFIRSATDEAIKPENIDEPLTYDDYSDKGDEVDNYFEAKTREYEDDEDTWYKNIGINMIDDIQEEIPETEARREKYDQEKREGQFDDDNDERLKMVDDFQNYFQKFDVDDALQDYEDNYLRDNSKAGPIYEENYEVKDEHENNEIPVAVIPYNSFGNGASDNNQYQDEEIDQPNYITVIGPVHEEKKLQNEPEDQFNNIRSIMDLFSALHLNKSENTILVHQEIKNYYTDSLPVGFSVNEFEMSHEQKENKDENTHEWLDARQ